MGNQHETPWLPEQVVFLETQWTAGATAGEIAKKVGRTRNAVIGKIDRMGFNRPDRARRIPRKRASYPEKGTRQYRSSAGSFARLAEPAGLPIEFRSVKNSQCRYIKGEVRGFDTPMCGDPIHVGAYCGFHDQLTHKYKNRPLATRAGDASGRPPMDSPSR